MLRAATASVLLAMMAAGTAAESPAATPAERRLDLGSLSLEQLLEIEVPIVYGASRYDQKATLAPSSVTLITADEIRRHGYRTVAEALNSLPGVFLSNDRNYHYLGIRGFLRPGDTLTRLLFLVDGHRMNDNVFGGTHVGTDSIVDLDLVDRIEFIPGPSSSIYGNSAFLGVVNVRTRRPEDIGGLEASVEAGSFDTRSARLTYGERYRNGMEVLISGSLYDSAGDDRLYYREFDQPPYSDGVAHDSDAERVYRLAGSVALNGLTLSGGFRLREKDIPTASYGSAFNSGREYSRELTAYADLRYEADIGDSTRVLARAYHDHSMREGHYPQARAPGPRSAVVDEARGDRVGAEIQVNQTLLDRHTILAGAEFRENLRQFRSTHQTEPYSEITRTDDSSREFGLYAQADIQLLPALHLNAGVRYDHYSAVGDTWNPRAGLIHQPWEGTTFKALYGRAFRAPNSLEMHAWGPNGYAFNPAVEPETIDTYELSWDQNLGRRHRVRLSAYLYEIDGLISQTGLLTYDNLEQVTGRGVELSWEGRFDHGIVARASYALQRAEDESTGREISNSPEHLAKLNLSVPVYRDRIFASLDLRYQGEVGTIQGGRVDDFLLVDFTLYSRELLKGLEASASIYNLFDTRFAYPGSSDHRQETIPQDGRTFRVKLTYRF